MRVLATASLSFTNKLRAGAVFTNTVRHGLKVGAPAKFTPASPAILKLAPTTTLSTSGFTSSGCVWRVEAESCAQGRSGRGGRTVYMLCFAIGRRACRGWIGLRRAVALLSVCPLVRGMSGSFLPLHLPFPYHLPFSHSIFVRPYATPFSSFTGASSTVAASSCRGGIVSNRGLM